MTNKNTFLQRRTAVFLWVAKKLFRISAGGRTSQLTRKFGDQFHDSNGDRVPTSRENFVFQLSQSKVFGSYIERNTTSLAHILYYKLKVPNYNVTFKIISNVNYIFQVIFSLSTTTIPSYPHFSFSVSFILFIILLINQNLKYQYSVGFWLKLLF